MQRRLAFTLVELLVVIAVLIGLILNAVNNPPYLGMTKGPVMSIDFGVSIDGITDGTSNTFLFHEVRMGVSPKDMRGTWALGFPGASMVVAGRDTNPTPNNAIEDADEIEACTEFFYPGSGARDRMGCRNRSAYGMAAQARSCHTGRRQRLLLRRQRPVRARVDQPANLGAATVHQRRPHARQRLLGRDVNPIQPQRISTDEGLR